MDSRVRRAHPRDVDSVRFIGVSTWPTTYGMKGAGFVMDGLDTYWSAETVGAAVSAGAVDVIETASGIVGMTEVEELGQDLVMWKLYVLPAEQRAGLGHALVEAVKGRARERGQDLLTEYDRANEVVRGFYLREGFEPVEPPLPGTDAVWLRWRREA